MRIVAASELADPIHVVGARIVGALRVERLDHPLVLRDCLVEDPITLRQASVPHLDLSGSRLRGLAAEQLHTTHDVDLSGVTALGGVTLTGAKIDGSVRLRGARLHNVLGVALRADGATAGWFDLTGAELTGTVGCDGLTVERDLVLDDVRLAGRLGLVGATIGGALTLCGARISSWRGRVLDAENITVGQNMRCDRLDAAGGIRMPGARIGGRLSFDGATLAGLGDFALDGKGMVVEQNAHFRNGFRSVGELRLSGARIKGQLSFTDGSLVHRNGIALKAHRITAEQGMFCRNTTAVGPVVVAGTQIVRGPLSLSGMRATTIDANGIVVGQYLWCDKGFTAGELSIVSASAQAVVLTGAHVDVLRARAVTVAQDVSLGGDFGSADLSDAHIHGRLDIRAATLAELDLTDAEVGDFNDSPRWPDTVRLEGFGYQSIADLPVKQRIKWLRRNPGSYTPGLYDTLANAYKRAGRLEYARKVNIAKQSHRRTEFNPLARAWSWLLYLTVGYGYRTSQAWLWLLVLLGAGTYAFAVGDFVPATPTVEAFNPLVYTLDALLPIVDLGQQKAWIARGAAQWWSLGLTAAGWMLTTAVVAGLTNSLRRD